MSNIKSNIKFHFFAYFFAVLAGVLVIFPNIYFISNLSSEYKGIYMMSSDAEPHYLSRMAGCVRGDGVGNPYYMNDGQKFPSTMFSISECIISTPSLVFGISISKLSLIYKFIFPTLMFLLVYLFLYEVLNKRLWSIVGSSLIIFGTQLISISDILNILRFKLVYGQFMHYSRPVNPEFSSLFFFGFLYLFLISFKKKTWLMYSFVGILFGLTFYLYFYTWTFLLAFLLISTSVFSTKKELHKYILNNIYILFSGIFLGFYALYQLYLFKTSSLFALTANDFELVSSHAPIVSLAGVLVSFLFVVYFVRQKEKRLEDYFILSLLLTAFAVINQQVLTGVVLQSGHYHWYFNTPIYFITLVYIFSKKTYLFVSEGFETILGLFLILLSIYTAIFVQYSSYVRNVEETIKNQDFNMVFDWLEHNTQKKSVVLAPVSISELLPIFSPCCYVAYEAHAMFYLMPPERRSYNEEKIIQSLKNNEKIPFNIDYIIWNTETDSNWMVDNIRGVKKEADFGRLKVFRFNKGS